MSIVKRVQHRALQGDEMGGKSRGKISHMACQLGTYLPTTSPTQNTRSNAVLSWSPQTMRFKNRYFVCEAIFESGFIDESVTSSHIFRAIQSSLEANFGDFGIASVMQSLNGRCEATQDTALFNLMHMYDMKSKYLHGPSCVCVPINPLFLFLYACGSFVVKYFNPQTSLCIIRCARDHHRSVWTAITLTNKIKAKVTLTCIHIGGTIRACQKAVLKHHKKLLAVLHRNIRELSQSSVAAVSSSSSSSLTSSSFSVSSEAAAAAKVIHADKALVNSIKASERDVLRLEL